eukprot:TRINITY_DN72602_c0_g1_i1.p1 TRINITY_DN72602_c0_g1~~TRINITY_DN72602_c0_g1_i1.p1  ORF type:complete len:431 (-),score=84.20 TRINITY_DN72602_c0_g1_i1:112-1404(-)
MMAESVSEEEILRLISERETARQARNFPQSDAIRDQLRSYGVELYDKDKQWKAKDGRSGYLFTAGTTTCLMSDEDIHALVAQREQARSDKDFGLADSIRLDLRNKGIELDDKTKIWRTGSGRNGTYSGQTMQSSSALSEQEIRQMIAERERLRSAHDYQAADDVRSRLAGMGVEIFDNQRIWRASDGRQGTIVTGGIEIVQCSLSDVQIRMRVQMREDARAQKDWGRADQVRDELRRCGVECVDQEQLWRTTDGKHGRYPEAMRSGYGMGSGLDHTISQVASQALAGIAGNQAFGQSASAPLSNASIEALCYGREETRNSRDFRGADLIREDLRNHGVEVFDQQKQWKARDGRQGYIEGPPAPGMMVAGGYGQPQTFQAVNAINAYGVPSMPSMPTMQPPAMQYQPQQGMMPGFGNLGMAQVMAMQGRTM